jgi:hypothetical protein
MLKFIFSANITLRTRKPKVANELYYFRFQIVQKTAKLLPLGHCQGAVTPSERSYRRSARSLSAV